MKTGLVILFASLAISSSSIFIPTLAKDFGASHSAISLIVAAYNIALFIAYYIFGRASDVYGRRLFLKIGLLASVFSFALQALAFDNATLLIARVLAGFTAGTFPAALTAYVFERKEDIGKFNSYGSFGWAMGTLLAGLIAYYKGIFILGSLSFMAAYIIALRLPNIIEKRVHVPIFPKELIKKNINVYIAFLFRHTGANMAWTILPLYMSNLGASSQMIGFLYFLNTGTQSVVMRFVGKYRSQSLINFGLLLSTIVFISYPMASNYLQVIPIQIVLGIAWSALYVGCLKTLDDENVEKATSTGLLYSASSLSAILGPLLCGMLPDSGNYSYVMAGAALISITGFAIDNLRKTIK
ncbi:MAG: MFS transporter [Candidatus Altiarchaeales archaeon]|nr:MFS transporter [Candidatus Altiarchaeales archaeon]